MPCRAVCCRRTKSLEDLYPPQLQAQGATVARQRLLSELDWAALLVPAGTEREMLRHYQLSAEDLDLIRSKRTDTTRLRFALLMLYCRYPGRVLGPDEVPPPQVVAFVARQLCLGEVDLGAGPHRDETRRQHLAELTSLFDLHRFDGRAMRDLASRLTPAAQIDPQPKRLALVAIDDLRQRRVMLPPAGVLEIAVRRARLNAERISEEAMTSQLRAQQRDALDQLLRRRPSDRLTTLTWLKQPSQSPAARNILSLIDRLHAVRRLRIDPVLRTAVPPPAFERLAEEGMRMTAQHLGQLVPGRRHAVLAATVVRLEQELTDATLSMADKLMGSLARKAERRTEQKVMLSVRDLQAHVMAFAVIGSAVITAHNEQRDPIVAIEREMGWQRFVRHVSQAATLVRPDATDSKVELLARYATLRSFAPAFLDAFAFQGSRSSASLLKAVRILRESWHTKRRSLPEDAPVGFIRRSWRAFVLPNGKISRRPYELCVLSELRDRLRTGDVWIEGSQHYQSFDAALIPQPSFDLMKADGPLPIALSPVWDIHLEGRRTLLRDKSPTSCWKSIAGPASRPASPTSAPGGQQMTGRRSWRPCWPTGSTSA